MKASIDTKALQAIEALQRPGKPNLLSRVITLFETTTPETLKALLDGIDNAELEAVHTAAHALKSSSAYIGATAMSDRCRNIERAARENNLAECVALADGLEDEFIQARDELQPHKVKAA